MNEKEARDALRTFQKRAFDPVSLGVGAGAAVAIPALIRRLMASQAREKALTAVQTMKQKGISTKELPFTIRHPWLGWSVAPTTLKKRVAQAERRAGRQTEAKLREKQLEEFSRRRSDG